MGVTLVSATPSQGTCSETTTLTCDVGSLGAGAANDATVTIVVRPGENGHAQRHQHGNGDLDHGRPDHVEQHQDLQVRRSSPSGSPICPSSRATRLILVEAGNDITYTLTAHYDGPDAAAGVSV